MMVSQHGRSSTNRGPHQVSWLRALLLAPLVIGSCAAFLALGGGGRRTGRRITRQFVNGEGSLLSLRDAILGSAKREIASVFGPPQSAAIRGSAADTWY